MLRELTGVLGLRLSDKQGSAQADPFVDLLLEVRSEVRKQKLWALSDLIRDRLADAGGSALKTARTAPPGGGPSTMPAKSTATKSRIRT